VFCLGVLPSPEPIGIIARESSNQPLYSWYFFVSLLFMNFTNKITIECREFPGWVPRSV
jgi:hypothetical protein